MGLTLFRKLQRQGFRLHAARPQDSGRTTHVNGPRVTIFVGQSVGAERCAFAQGHAGQDGRVRPHDDMITHLDGIGDQAGFPGSRHGGIGQRFARVVIGNRIDGAT